MSIKIQSRTLQIQPSGARLSPDLSEMGDAFLWKLDRKKKVLVLEATKSNGAGALRLWKSGVRSKSKLIALRSAIAQLGLDYDKLEGQVFDVKVHGKTLEVKFG